MTINWIKVLKVAVIVALVVAIGGWVYEKVSNIRLSRSTSAAIERLERDYQRVLDGLGAVTDILAGSEGVFEDYYLGSGELAGAIEGSLGLAEQLRGDVEYLISENSRFGS